MILLLFILIPILPLGITVGLHEWEIGQRAMLYELGRRTATPSFQDLLKIIFVAFGQTLIVAALGGILYFAIYLFLRWSIKRQIRQQLRELDLWVAKYQDKIIGIASLQIKRNHSILLFVDINPEHRNHGVGSYLVWNSVKDANKPIYLTCLPQLQSFYDRLGFVSIENSPPELKRHRLYTVMVLLEMPTIPTVPQSSVLSRRYGYSIRPLHNFTKRWFVYQKFWSRKLFRQSRIYMLTLMLVFLTPVIVIWAIAAIFNITFIGTALSLIILSTLGLTIFSRWQEWIVESSERPIAYAHLSNRPNCSILYSLYIDPQYQRVIIAQAFLEYFTRRIQLPFYVICRREEVKFFNQLEFVTTNQQFLPFELKILRFANQVVLMLSN